MQVTVPYPTCYKCGKKVERMTLEDSLQLNGLIVTVYCHGQSDSCVLPAQSVMNATKILAGVAFKPKEGNAKSKPRMR